MGPCSQKIIETPKDEFYRICFLNYAEVKPETVIIDYYEQKMDYLAKFQSRKNIQFINLDL